MEIRGNVTLTTNDARARRRKPLLPATTRRPAVVSISSNGSCREIELSRTVPDVWLEGSSRVRKRRTRASPRLERSMGGGVSTSSYFNNTWHACVLYDLLHLVCIGIDRHMGGVPAWVTDRKGENPRSLTLPRQPPRRLLCGDANLVRPDPIGNSEPLPLLSLSCSLSLPFGFGRAHAREAALTPLPVFNSRLAVYVRVPLPPPWPSRPARDAPPFTLVASLCLAGAASSSFLKCRARNAS